MAEIRVPALGESVTEATIGKWFKKPGEVVAVDEPLVELETDKVTIEVPAPAAGVLADIAAKDGDTVAVGAVLGQIKEGAAGAAQHDDLDVLVALGHPRQLYGDNRLSFIVGTSLQRVLAKRGRLNFEGSRWSRPGRTGRNARRQDRGPEKSHRGQECRVASWQRYP